MVLKKRGREADYISGTLVKVVESRAGSSVRSSQQGPGITGWGTSPPCICQASIAGGGTSPPCVCQATCRPFSCLPLLLKSATIRSNCWASPPRQGRSQSGTRWLISFPLSLGQPHQPCQQEGPQHCWALLPPFYRRKSERLNNLLK